MKKNITKTFVVFFLVVTLLVGVYGIYKYGNKFRDQQSRTTQEQNYKKLDTNTGLAHMQIDESYINYEQALEAEGSLEQLHTHITGMSDVDFFMRMYGDFKNLESYSEYKEYTKKYPELLPVIYAVRLGEKDVYLKFYGFLFDKVVEEGGDMQDMKNITGGLEGEELRQSLLKIFEDHYNTLIKGELEFTGQFGDDPLNIALSYGEIEKTKGYCDSSSISGIDNSTKAECYGYIYQFRATHENRFCEQIESGYQAKLCRGFIDYTSNLHTN